MIEVRIVQRHAPQFQTERAFVQDLGRRCAMSSVGPLRTVPERVVSGAFDRLLEVAESQSHVIFVARIGERHAGFLLMLDDLPDDVTALPQAFVAYMAVEPAFRRRRVGRALLDAAEQEARRRGLPHVALMVTEENRAARTLYERSGFQTERRLLCKPL